MDVDYRLPRAPTTRTASGFRGEPGGCDGGVQGELGARSIMNDEGSTVRDGGRTRYSDDPWCCPGTRPASAWRNRSGRHCGRSRRSAGSRRRRSSAPSQASGSRAICRRRCACSCSNTFAPPARRKRRREARGAPTTTGHGRPAWPRRWSAGTALRPASSRSTCGRSCTSMG